MKLTHRRAETVAADGLISVVLPAFNEAHHLPKLLHQLGRIMTTRGDAFQIIVVDDGSNDQTSRAAASAARQLPIKVIAHPRNTGMGGALRSGLLEAIPESRIIVTMDADNTHDPVLIPRMLDRLDNGFDVVIASRFDEGGAELGMGRRRQLLRKTANAVLRRMTPLKGVRDYSSGYRVYRADLLKRLVATHGKDAFIRERGFACRLEMLLKATSEGARIVEVPLLVRYDKKANPGKKPIWRTMRRYGAVVRSHRPALRPAAPDPTSEPAVEQHASARVGEFGHRLLSIAVATVGLVLTAPLMALIAALVKFTSPGPVLYAQTRVGLDRRQGNSLRLNSRRQGNVGGRPFRIYKFRTMEHVPARAHEQVWASPDDPRVTTIGRLLRKCRLDELPQLYNVLRGDMNVVGPRPEQPKIFADLRTKIGRYGERQRVPPGITGWAQVSASYDQTLDDVRRKVAYDLEYLQRRSVTEDLKIMLRTIPVVLLQRGAW